MYDDFEKLVDNTRITVGCVNKKLSAGTRSYKKNGVSNKEDPEMKKINFYKRRKNYEERINTFISLLSYVEKRKVLRYHSRKA